MDLNNIIAPAPNQRKRKRIGRGEGSGKGNHTVGKGHKGQKSRTGFSQHPAFEGGQMPLFRRIPKFGFNNHFRKEYVPLNVETIQAFVERGKLSEEISIQDMVDAGIMHKNARVKILGTGEITTKITVEAHKASGSAISKIEEAGGSVTLIEQ